MLLLTFLGNPKEYHQTTYWWDGQEKQTRFAPVASCVFHHADRMIVFLTGEAERNWYQPLLEELPPDVAAEPVRDIPLGKKDTELWEIFNRICTAVPPEEEVVFDITHGFRSSPQSTKAQMMAARVQADHKNVRWWCPQLPPSPRPATALIQRGPFYPSYDADDLTRRLL